MDAPDLPDVTQLAIPGFVALMVLELIVGRVTGRVRYETRDTLASLAMGSGSVVEGVVLGFVSLGVLVWFHQLALFDFGWSIPAFVVCFVADDLRYYWYHRLSHERRWLWASHVNHHSSQHYNLSTALRQTWSGTIAMGFLFAVPLVVLGFDPLMIAFVQSINLVYQFWIHTEVIVHFPRWFEAVMNTPSHHRVHHARNARYLDANYAGVFIVWDRMFGTFVPELREEPCRYGLVRNLGTFNPLRIAMHEWVALVADAARPGLTVRQRLAYVFGPPGYSHDGSRQTTADLKRAWAARRIEEA